MRYLHVRICSFVVMLLMVLSCKANPADKAAEYMKLGDNYSEQQEFRKAIIEYKNAIQADPSLARAHYQLALAYLQTFQPKEAFAELSRAVDLDPDNLDAQLRLGRFLLVAGQTEEAKEKAEIVLQKEPENMNGLFLQMGALLREGKGEMATGVLKKIISIDEKNAEAYLALARIALSQKNPAEAKDYLDQAVAAHPDDPAPRLARADFYEQRGQHDQAKREIEEAIVRDRENALLFRELGNFLQRRGDLAGAESAYLKMEALAPDKISPKISLGVFYASHRNWEQALQWLKKGLELQSENVEIKNALAAVYVDMGQPEEAERLIESVLEKDPDNLRSRFLNSRLLLEKKEFNEAAELLDDIINDQPRHGGALYYRGLIYLAEGDQPRAKAALLKAVAYTPRNLKARLALAQIYLAERSSDLALEQAQTVLASEPENYNALLLQGKSYLLNGDQKQALEAFEKAAEVNPNEPAALYQLATLNILEERHNDALVQLDKILLLDPGHLPAIRAKVSLYSRQSPSRALSFLDQKLREHESNSRLAAVLHEMRGILRFSQKDYKQSEAEFKKALELSPDLAAPYFSLARLYQVTGETDKAISQYQTILNKQPRSIQASMALGALYDSVGRKTEARTMYENTLEINPDFAPAANNLAWLLLQQNENPDRALELARRAKALLPNDPNVADTLGLALIRKGLYSSAISELNQAAQELSDNPAIFYHLGLAHWKIGDRYKAMAALDQALKMKRDFPERRETEELLQEIKTD